MQEVCRETHGCQQVIDIHKINTTNTLLVILQSSCASKVAGMLVADCILAHTFRMKAYF